MLFACTPARSQPTLPFVPQVDHHQHLLSPSLAAALSRSVPAPVELPKELNRRFREGAPRHNDSSAIADFYTEDAIVAFSLGALFQGVSTNWLRGRHQIAGFLSRAFRNQYSLTPFAYSVDDSSGYIAGYFSGIPRHYDVHLSLRKGGDGAWRIAAQSITYAPRPTLQPLTADELIAHLDAAGIRRALVLSLAYIHGSPAFRRENEHAQTRAENDWTSQQVARYPDRLRAFCSVNPLREYALTELQRCANDPNLRHGLKLHFANSQVDLRNDQHVQQLRVVFRAANARRMPIVAHIWTGNETTGAPYGRAEADVFLKDLLPAAPDIPIQIAHLAGAGRLDRGSKEALTLLADAVAARDPRTRNLYFDVTTNVTMETSREEAEFLAASLRRIGLERILYGSDMASLGNVPPRQGWGAFRAMLPLTEAEFRTIAENVAPYMR
jgi:predicted TIM-barrel fold metal-dependent hydrolase